MTQPRPRADKLINKCWEKKKKDSDKCYKAKQRIKKKKPKAMESERSAFLVEVVTFEVMAINLRSN